VIPGTASALGVAAAELELKKRMDSESSGGSYKTIDQKARELDTNFFQGAAVIHRNGLSTREYLVLSLTLFNDVMMVGMKKQGAIREYRLARLPPRMRPS